MNALLFTTILKEMLVPFTREVYSHCCRLIQDNDPKHCSRVAQVFYKEMDIEWWRTPMELPDLHPIENMWHELKEISGGIQSQE